MQLTGKQRRHLRALAHSLSPVVHIGKDGLTPSLVAAVKQALFDHELIKVKLGDAADVDRHEAGDQLAAATASHVAQVLGYMLVLYKAHPTKPVIALP